MSDDEGKSADVDLVEQVQGARCKVHQCNEFRLPPFTTARQDQLTTLMMRMILIIFNDDKIIIMIRSALKVKVMVTTILTMMVLQSHMLARGWNMMPRKTASRWLILFSPAKDARFLARLVTPIASGICECLSETYPAPVSTSQSTCIKTIWKRKLKWLFIFHAPPHTRHICPQICAAQIANFVWLSRVMIFYGRPLSQIYVTRPCSSHMRANMRNAPV